MSANSQMTTCSVKPTIISNLPVELWEEILQIATKIDGQDEFGRDSSVWSITPEYGYDVTPAFVAPSRQRSALRDRCNIVLVCKLWHAVGTRLLWSHLIINMKFWMGGYLSRIPAPGADVWTFVRCLHILYTPRKSPKSNQDTIDRLCLFLNTYVYPNLVDLEVLHVPLYLASGNHLGNPKILALSQSQKEYKLYGWLGAMESWKYTRFLDLDLSYVETSSLLNKEGTTLPHLIKLRVVKPWDASVMTYITSHWKTPQLRFLSVGDSVVDRIWEPLVNWASNILETLFLKDCLLEDCDPIDFPALTTLVLQNCVCRNWEQVLRTPHLQRLSFSGPKMNIDSHDQRQAFVSKMNVTVRAIPMCSKISYYTTYGSLRFAFNPQKPDSLLDAMQDWVATTDECDSDGSDY